jgi:dihydroorotase
MNVLLKSATIVDASSKHHLKKRDILIENGIITKIAATITNSSVKEITLKNLHISQGWFDPSVSFGEPGYEERETIENGLKTAALSGFANVAINTNTNPVTDTKSTVQFLKSKAYKNAVTLYPIGALSVGSKGEDLAEMYDMQNEGAVAFYDYKVPISNANLLKIALQYAQNFNGLVQSFPLNATISPKGMVHEHVNSTKLGLKGIPSLAEELQITRDLYILEYTGGRLHIPTISTKKSVELIKEAKKKGLNVTCSVAINNIMLTDEALETFDANFKLQPPLRTKEDVNALLKGLKEGTIDGVTSDHNPIDIEHKNTEFDHAFYGSIGLESCFGALNKKVGFENAIVLLTGLKNEFSIKNSPISEDAIANLTLFNPEGDWTFSEEHITSTSKNAALLGKKLKGKAYGIFGNKKLILAN